LRHAYGDCHTYLHIFGRWARAGYTHEWCLQNFINFRAMKTAKKVREHLVSDSQTKRLEKSLQKNGAIRHTASLDRRIADALTAGYFMNAAMQCANDSIYKLLPLEEQLLGTDGESSSKRRKKSGSDYVTMVHTHPQSVFSQIQVIQ